MKTTLMLLSGLIGVLAILYSCKTKKASMKDHDCQTSLEKLAHSKLGDTYELAWNDSEDYALVSKKIKKGANEAFPTLKFFIFEKSSSSAIYENTEPGGSAEWENNDVIKVTSMIGIVQADGNTKKPSYKYHVRNKKKFSGNFLGN